MIKNQKLLIVAGLSLSLMFGGALLVSAKTKLPVTPKPGSTFEQRLNQRKLERQVKLSKDDRQRLIEQCSTAQNNLRVLQTDTTTIVDKRLATYNRIDAKLWVMVGQVKLAQKDSFNLEKAHKTYTKKLKTFKVTAANYQQVLDDLTIIKCQADIVGFKALLDTARIYLKDIRAEAKDLRKFVVNNVKTTLNKYSTQLQAETVGGGQP